MKEHNKERKPPAPPQRTRFSAREKCQAVLALWAGRRRPSELCRELGIRWVQLNHWQGQAMEGMLKSLEPRTRSEEEKGPALSAKLERLLERKALQRAGQLARLDLRLARIQRKKEPAQTSETSPPA